MSSSDSDASSVAHENKKKKVKARVATPPAKKKVKPPPTAEQIAKTTRDIDDVVSSLGTPASKSSSGEKSPFHKDSICNKLREHFVLVKKEDGGREVTCKLCSAEKPWTMCVDSLNGFGNVGKHFRRHHKKEYDRAGCGTNHERVSTDDRNRLMVQSMESCLLVMKLQDWNEKLGTTGLRVYGRRKNLLAFLLFESRTHVNKTETQ